MLRLLKIQVKSGYIPESPEFKFLMRYPPIARRMKAPIIEFTNKQIPYFGLYQSIKAKNPILEDERVYSAVWEQEPQALAMAKKQYELMRFKGLDEKSAYDEAFKHVNNLENIAYGKLKDLNKILEAKGVSKTYIADPNLASEITKWQQILENTSYDQLQPADQGEVDHLIQIQILKWQEVERERRMKDPVFVMQFERLRDQLFPKAANSSRRDVKNKSAVDPKVTLSDFLGVDKARLRTSFPFYYQDYLRFFEKSIREPDFKRWAFRDKDNIGRWISETIAIHEVMDMSKSFNPDRLNIGHQQYMELLRSHFFPAFQFPDKAHRFSLPSVDDLKRILYDRDIGYKAVDGKLFIRRFYRLPSILFPEETLTTTLLRSKEKLSHALESETFLRSEMNNAGLREATVSDLRDKLQDYMTRSQTPKTSYSSDFKDDMSPLEALLSDSDDGYKSPFGRSTFSRFSGTSEKVEQSKPIAEAQESSEVSQSEPEVEEILAFPSQKQWDAWDMLRFHFESFLHLLVRMHPKDAERIAVYQGYLNAQMQGCQPSQDFILKPRDELVSFRKFVDDLGALQVIVERRLMADASADGVPVNDSFLSSETFKLLTSNASESELESLKEFGKLMSGASAEDLAALKSIIEFAASEESLLLKIKKLVTFGDLITGDEIIVSDIAEIENEDEGLSTPEELKKFMAKYTPTPETELDKDREEYMNAMLQRFPENAKNEADLYILNQDRVDSQIILRARFSRMYEKKEAARRARKVREDVKLLDLSKKRPLTLVYKK